MERYEYDALGRRSRIITAATNDNDAADIGIVNDGPDRYLDLSGPATIAKRFIHGAGVDEPYEMQAFDSAGLLTGRFTYHTDHLGSVRFMTDQAGNITNEYDYDSYGRVTGEVETVEQPFGFTGRDYDEAVNLYQYRARAYDPETGRFIQEDPIHFSAGDLNIYRYVHNNPLNYTDPSGLAATAENATLGALIGTAFLAGYTLSTAAIRDTEGATLAAEIATKSLSSVARVGAGIACKLLTVASGISIGGTPNTLCSTSNEDEDDDAFPDAVPDPGTIDEEFCYQRWAAETAVCYGLPKVHFSSCIKRAQDRRNLCYAGIPEDQQPPEWGPGDEEVFFNPRRNPRR